jgi:hypothetical protein
MTPDAAVGVGGAGLGMTTGEVGVASSAGAWSRKMTVPAMTIMAIKPSPKMPAKTSNHLDVDIEFFIPPF